MTYDQFFSLRRFFLCNFQSKFFRHTVIQIFIENCKKSSFSDKHKKKIEFVEQMKKTVKSSEWTSIWFDFALDAKPIGIGTWIKTPTNFDLSTFDSFALLFGSRWRAKKKINTSPTNRCIDKNKLSEKFAHASQFRETEIDRWTRLCVPKQQTIFDAISKKCSWFSV